MQEFHKFEYRENEYFQKMEYRLTARTAFVILIAAFIFHNIEEAIFICNYQVQNPIAFIEPANCRQFLVAVSIITAFVLTAFIIAIRIRKSSLYLFISTAIAAGLVLNVLIPHVAVALYSVNYTPGLVTGVLLILPSGIIVLSKNRYMCDSRKQFYKYIGLGLVIGYLVFALIMRLVLLYIL